MTAENQLIEWFEKYGVVIPVTADPRGEYWVRGYLNEIADMFVDQVVKAEKRGANKVIALLPDREADRVRNKLKGGDDAKPQVPAKRKRGTPKASRTQDRAVLKEN